MASWAAVSFAAVEAIEPGLAPPAGAQLLYVRETGAESCPSAAGLRESVAARLGYDPFERASETRLLARIRLGEGGFVGSIELVDAGGHPHGKRELSTQGESCDEMAQALALSISIAIAPERALAGLGAEPAAAAPAPVAPSAPAPAPAPVVDTSRGPATDRVSPRPANAPRAHVQLSLAALTLVGVAPNAAFGGLLTAQDRWGAWAMGAGARFTRSARAEVQQGAQLETTFAAGELNGCFQHAPFEQCAVLLIGATWVWSNRVSEPRTDVGIFGAAAWRSSVVATISERFALLAQLEGQAVLSPIHPQVDGQDVWYAPRLVGGLAAGARARF